MDCTVGNMVPDGLLFALIQGTTYFLFLLIVTDNSVLPDWNTKVLYLKSTAIGLGINASVPNLLLLSINTTLPPFYIYIKAWTLLTLISDTLTSESCPLPILSVPVGPPKLIIW